MGTRLRFGLVGALLAACGPGSRPAAPPDAEADAYVSPWKAEPISVSGSTPQGPVDLHYIRAVYDGCGHSYEVQILPSVDPDADPRLYLTAYVGFPEDAPFSQNGMFDGYVIVRDGFDSPGTQASFTAKRIDPPKQPDPHVIGRFVANAPGWSLDFTFDVVSWATNDVCDF